MRVFDFLRTSLVLVIVTWAASGCAIYSESRDKQGKSAKDSWSKVDLAAQFTATRQNQQALLDERLKLEDELWSQRRDNLAQWLTGVTVAEFRSRINNDAKRLLGDQTLAELSKRDQALRTAKVAYQVDTAGARAAGLAVMSCDVVRAAKDVTGKEPEKARAALVAAAKAAPAAAADYVKKVNDDEKDNCGTLAKGMEGFGGELGTAQAELKRDLDELKESRVRAEIVQAAYRSAVAEYDAAAKQFSEAVAKGGDTDDVRGKLDADLKKVAEALEALKDAQDSFSIKVVSEARLDSVDRFLSTYTDIRNGKGSPENANKAAIALAVFPDLRLKAQKVLSDLEKPNLVPLTLQKGVEKAKLDGAKRDIEVINTRLALRQAYIDVLVAEGKAYWQADRALSNAAVRKFDTTKMFNGLQPLTAKELEDRTDAGPVEGKKLLWMSTALYLDAEGRLRAEGAKTQHQIISLSYEQAASLAESNLKQWKSLVDPSVELMVAYGESGVKSSDIASFLNSLTLLWIGAGVNR